MKKMPSASRQSARHTLDALRRALARRRKADLIACLVELARNDADLRHRIADHLDFDLPQETVAEDNVEFIQRATWFDPRQINHNFAYDHDAYEQVRRNFVSMVASQRLDEAMDQAELLMKLGSEQVEMSDEGLMPA